LTRESTYGSIYGMDKMPKHRELSPDEIAAILGVSRTTVYDWRNSGRLAGFSVGDVVSLIESERSQAKSTYERRVKVLGSLIGTEAQ